MQRTVGISVRQNGIDKGGEVAALAAADAVQLLGELLVGDGQIGIAGSFAYHGAGHQRVDNRGIRRTGLYLHQCLGLRVYGNGFEAVFTGNLLTGGTGLHCIGQIGNFSRGGGIGGASVLAPQATRDKTIIAERMKAVNFFMCFSSNFVVRFIIVVVYHGKLIM